MKNIEKTDIFRFTVDPFETDCNNRISWNVLGRNILSAATKHAQKRGFDKYEKDGVPYLWVLSRLIIEIDHLPQVGEEYELHTWIKNYYRFFTDRYFYICNGEGKVIGKVLTIWAMINSETRQSADLKTLFGNSFDQYINLDEDVEINRSRIRVKNASELSQRKTYFTDLDTNGHLNSIKYIEFLLDTFPFETTKKQAPKRIEMEYCMETYIDNMLTIKKEEIAPQVFQAEFTRTKEDKEVTVCRAQVTF